MSDNSLRYWSLPRFKYDRPIALTQVLGEMMRVSGPCRRGLSEDSSPREGLIYE